MKMTDYKNRVTPDNITELKPDEVFVFGSNLAGKHGRGAAAQALQWGAKYGKFFGHVGQTFALPTKNAIIQTLGIPSIKWFVDGFIEYAKKKKELTFLVTPIGTGLAGYTPEQIAPLFKDAIDLPNVHLPKRFWEVLEKIDN